MTGTTEYLRRNIVVAQTYGVIADCRCVLAKLQTLKRPQKWLRVRMEDAVYRLESVLPDVIKHRDEVKK
jgi:hypothetical protein